MAGSMCRNTTSRLGVETVDSSCDLICNSAYEDRSLSATHFHFHNLFSSSEAHICEFQLFKVKQQMAASSTSNEKRRVSNLQRRASCWDRLTETQRFYKHTPIFPLCGDQLVTESGGGHCRRATRQGITGWRLIDTDETSISRSQTQIPEDGRWQGTSSRSSHPILPVLKPSLYTRFLNCVSRNHAAWRFEE
jgi:hypothetical protein